jgi:hypothetical protein
MMIKLQPYERAFVLAVAMTPGIPEGKQRSILIRYVSAIDRPAMEKPIIDLFNTFIIEQQKQRGI